jgi:hypothetical protein
MLLLLFIVYLLEKRNNIFVEEIATRKTRMNKKSLSSILMWALAAASTAPSDAFLSASSRTFGGAVGTLPIRGGGASHHKSTAVEEDTPVTLPDFKDKEEFLNYLEGKASLPKGFATGTAKGTFVSKEAPAMGDLPIRGTVIQLTDGPTDNWAAVFTSNKFPGAPVIVGRKRLSAKGPLSAIVINNKVSNVCSGGDGVGDSEMVCEAVAKALNLEAGASAVLPSSTGVIGWRLPAKELANDVVPEAIKNLNTNSGMSAASEWEHCKIFEITLF